MFRSVTIGASCTTLAFLLAIPVRAEEPERADPIIVTAQRATQDARREVEKRPGGVDVVDADSFADRVAVSLRDTLAFSPGVYIQPRFGQEVRLSIRGSGISRGFHMRGLTLLQDGIPINLADDNGDFQELDPQVFERIEVYRGGNALRYGGSTLGGAINAVTPTGRTAPGVELRVDGGSFDTLRTKAAAGFTNARGDAYVAVTTDRSDGDRTHASREGYRFNGNVGLRLSDTIETRFYATISHIQQDLPGSLSLRDALADPRLPGANVVRQDQERDIDSIRLQNRTTVALGNGTLAIGAFYNAKQLFHPIFQVIDQQSNDYGAFATVDLAGTTGGLPWELTLGTQARFGSMIARQFVNVAGERGALRADTYNTARTINSYAELRVTPVERLTLIAGGIYTNGQRRIDNHLLPQRSGDVDYDAFAPKIGALFTPMADVQFYANYSRSVELPGFSELSQTPNTGLPGFVGLNPQKAWTAEIGTRGHRGIIAWDISLYRADLRGEMLQFAVTPDATIPASTFNAGRTRHQGIEAGIDLSLLPWLRLRQVYQHNDFRFRGDRVYRDNRLPVIPRDQYRAELRLGSDALGVTPNLEWVPNGGYADYTNLQRTPGYVLLGLGAQAQVRDGVTLFADARNLTAKKAIGDISAASTPALASFYPVERRAVYGGVRARF